MTSPESSFRPRKKSAGARSTGAGRKSFGPPIPGAPGQAPWPADHVERRPLDRLVPYARNARKHGARQVAEIAASMSEFGWTMPLLIDEQDRIIVGHGRVLGAERLGWTEAPVLVARGWSEKQIRAYRLADNQIALHSSWDNSLLAVELADLRDQGVDLELMGFTAADALAGASGPGGADELPQALQLEPAREYAVIMCADAAEWERLKVALDLTPVRRGGYKKGSLFDDVGTQRVVPAAEVLRLIAPATPRRRAKPSTAAAA